MRTVPSSMWDLWAQGGPFIGENKPGGRVTVEPGWYLNTDSSVFTPDASKLPYRWFQRIDNSQTEVEVPNIKSIDINRTLDSDAATFEVIMYNVEMDLNTSGRSSRLGVRGRYTWQDRNLSAFARWGDPSSDWNNILIPNCLVRTYQGFGGEDKSIPDAISDGNIVLTGLWLADEIDIATDGLLHIKGRDMAKLLIEQQIYPPFVPSSKYPLQYHRFTLTPFFSPAVPFYDSTDPVQSSPDPAEGPKYVTDIAMSADNNGYWVVGTDGGVFAYGVPFYGSRGSNNDGSPMVGIAADPLNRGYWICTKDGTVFSFGEAGHYGSRHGLSIPAPVTKIVAHPIGRGYWLVCEDGTVYAYGSASYVAGSLPPTGGHAITDMISSPSGNGYLLLSNNGGVFAYGDAVFHGSFIDSSSNHSVSIARVPDGSGYWVVRKNGDVSPFGTASGSIAANGPWDPSSGRTLNDPIFAMSATHDGGGYVLAGGDGGVFSFGDAPFWGSLPDTFSGERQTEGNYTDYADIIKDLLLWAGWLAEGTGSDDVYGNIETTGAYAFDNLVQDMFDKQPIINPINQIKEIVGYLFWVDDEGAARFEFPNWFSIGNRMDTGARVTTVPVIDERAQLTDYTVTFADKDWRSEIIVASNDPAVGFANTLSARFTLPPTNPPIDRGLIRPAMWTNERFTDQTQQEKMAELVGLYIIRSLRQGNVTCVANPALQINDQVRILERTAGETYIHYIRGLTSHQDLDTGQYTMQLTTNWLADDPSQAVLDVSDQVISRIDVAPPPPAAPGPGSGAYDTDHFTLAAEWDGSYDPSGELLIYDNSHATDYVDNSWMARNVVYNSVGKYLDMRAWKNGSQREGGAFFWNRLAATGLSMAWEMEFDTDDVPWVAPVELTWPFPDTTEWAVDGEIDVCETFTGGSKLSTGESNFHLDTIPGTSRAQHAPEVATASLSADIARGNYGLDLTQRTLMRVEWIAGTSIRVYANGILKATTTDVSYVPAINPHRLTMQQEFYGYSDGSVASGAIAHTRIYAMRAYAYAP